MTTPTAGAFHTHDGLYFRRGDNNAVQVIFPIRTEGEVWPERYETVTLDANTWGSVVASVRAFHDGGAPMTATPIATFTSGINAAAAPPPVVIVHDPRGGMRA
jgi:hypothetical protein